MLPLNNKILKLGMYLASLEECLKITKKRCDPACFLTNLVTKVMYPSALKCT